MAWTLTDALSLPHPAPSPDGWLVALSALAAVTACVLVMQITGLAHKAAVPLQARLAHLSAALTLGTGLWVVHLLGAFALGLQGTALPADDGGLLLSIVPTVAAAWLGLDRLAAPPVSYRRCATAGLLISAGMLGSHIGAVAAAGTPWTALLGWHDLPPLLLSGLGFGWAFWLRLGRGTLGRSTGQLLKRDLLAGGVAGAGLVLSHYLSLLGMHHVLASLQVGTDPIRLSQTLLVFLLVLLVAGGSATWLAYRQTVQALSDKEHRFAAILDNALDGLVTFDAQGRLLTANVRARELLGLPADGLPERRLHSWLCTDTDAPDPDPLGLIRPGVRELLLLKADSRRLAVRLSVGQARLPPQDVFVGLLSDITEETHNRRRRQELRSELASFARAMTEHSVYAETNSAGTITRVNEAFARISGHPAEALIGQDHRLLRSGVHPREFWDDLWAHMRSGRPWRREVCNRARDGHLYWLDSTVTPVLDSHGHIRRIVCMSHDITARKADEKLLRNTQQALEMSNRAAGIGTWDHEVGSAQVHWSPVTCQIFGVPSGTALGLSDALGRVRQVHALRLAAGRALRHGQGWDLELTIVTADGRELWVRHIGNAEWHEGRCERLYGTVQDIDSRKRHELDLAEAREAAEAASRSKDRFLTTMSHELRTPMNAILGFGQMLQIDPELTPLQQDNVAEILQAGGHLLELINDVLDLAKINTGKVEMSLEPVPLANTLRDCEQLVRGLAERHGVTLHLPEAPTAVLWADALRLRQVLLNLLTNAVKYNRADGQVVVALQAGPRGQLRLEVSDTGRGIPPERMDDLFKPFQRLDTDGASIEGTGIGLCITRQLLELMGGTIGVRSQPGLGSTFWITLPLAPTAAPHPKVPHASTA
ncbi:ATP-binding protein [Aquabacterium sp. A08]|uniref:ATP-binding protein n=1 Tax=Aquabacterium sp. A08 TaxID=2718532 RepID=UPI001423B732|nr:ATP-binding protein [Aquabacterium sp. A08]NIC40952.1 PAS domain S-box protein [Aquabacterium sp. A08]NIC40960.1 PAS domain S-box protein [Aquabacterium sp. A08]NIC42089.1 PAS domain S-box protein [Aquabacterium sp. A08]NIC42137.1 PAS domain S-box protein [Aquabacterium sp. A08]